MANSVFGGSVELNGLLPDMGEFRTSPSMFLFYFYFFYTFCNMKQKQRITYTISDTFITLHVTSFQLLSD